MADEQVTTADEEVASADELLEERRLDPEVEARRRAALTFVRRFGDPILKSRATPVDKFDQSTVDQVRRMAGLMEDALGVGLAAPSWASRSGC